MRTTNLFPARYMRGLATGSFRDLCEIRRNDGYGWKVVGSVRCNIHHRITPAIPADPTDASAANAEFVEIHHAESIPSRIGDRVLARGNRWTIGGGNFDETYSSYRRAMAARPIAATPRTWLVLRRWNSALEQFEPLPPQLVQVAWSKNQPDRLGGVAVRQFGWIFAPEEATADLDVQQGDTFYYGGREGLVTWVPPDPTERREAIFQMNIGEGT